MKQNEKEVRKELANIRKICERMDVLAGKTDNELVKRAAYRASSHLEASVFEITRAYNSEEIALREKKLAQMRKRK